ncbi:MAG: acetyl-CoA carboxylase biotin carboxyl carrier protein subunit [Syntrophus sp. (in: bacteria)]|nr:acetyl-CoA carboxylase biotin carboxyl carrier protein subunit [Syntrophus sp. (in: bacteria)]
MRKFRIHLNGKTYEVAVEEIGETEGTTSQADKPFKTPTNPPVPASANGDETITAPMPGKILSIDVKVGQKVESGDLILCLEAMKMESDIFCARAGTVKEIREEVGASVNAGDVIAVIG